MSKLKMMRFKMGLTQKQVAKGIGVAEASYGNWEKGERVPHPQNVKKLADFYKVPIEDIFFTFYDHNNSQNDK